MAKEEFKHNGGDFDQKEPDDSKGEPIAVMVSMQLKEAEIRRRVASGVQGVQFESFSNKEYIRRFGDNPSLPSGLVIGRSEADSWDEMKEYNRKVEKLNRKS